MNIISVSGDTLHVHVKRHKVELLISFVFFIGGGYFLYLLIGILSEHIVSASIQDWIESLPGMIIMLILSLVIWWPGAYMAAVDSVVVDSRSGIIAKRKEMFGLSTRGMIVQFGDVKSIVCRQKTRSRTRRTVGSTSETTVCVTYYIVDLNLKNGQQAELLEYTEKSGALELAKAVAESTGISLDDRL